jgi:Zn-dependent peptidase ImmA (M78 family)
VRRSHDMLRIASIVAQLRSQVANNTDLRRSGPVPLARFLDECNLLHVALPKLTRAVVYDFLMAEGMIPGDLGQDEALAGFLYVTPSAGFVFVNADDPVSRRRFTAAHELGHFVLHRNEMGGRVSIGDTPATVVDVEDDATSAMERQANYFAAELLMPADVCRERAGVFRRQYKVCPRSPFAYHLAADLLVSSEAMRYRLRELEVGDGD